MKNVILNPDHEVTLFHDMLTISTTDAQVFTIDPGKRVVDLSFEILGLTGETESVTLSSDGTNYGAALTISSILDLGTGKNVTAATLGNGKYKLNKPFPTFQKIAFTKSAGVETVYISLAAALVPSV